MRWSRCTHAVLLEPPTADVSGSPDLMLWEGFAALICCSSPLQTLEETLSYCRRQMPALDLKGRDNLCNHQPCCRSQLQTYEEGTLHRFEDNLVAAVGSRAAQLEQLHLHKYAEEAARQAREAAKVSSCTGAQTEVSRPGLQGCPTRTTAPAQVRSAHSQGCRLPAVIAMHHKYMLMGTGKIMLICCSIHRLTRFKPSLYVTVLCKKTRKGCRGHWQGQMYI